MVKEHVPRIEIMCSRNVKSLVDEKADVQKRCPRVLSISLMLVFSHGNDASVGRDAYVFHLASDLKDRKQ